MLGADEARSKADSSIQHAAEKLSLASQRLGLQTMIILIT